MYRGKNLLNKRFSKLLVTERIGSKNGRAIWKCLCDCGKTNNVSSTHLLTNHTRSCGCGERKTHDMSKTKQYKVWANMLNRCRNEKLPRYKDWGGRGISVCKRWYSFINFWEDMEKGYKDDLQIDRIDNNSNYSLSNCKWSTRKQQMNNRRK